MMTDDARSPLDRLGEMVDAIFGDGPDSKRTTAPRPASKIRSRTVDGVRYVRADDVADALERDAPTACANVIRKLRDM